MQEIFSDIPREKGEGYTKPFKNSNYREKKDILVE